MVAFAVVVELSSLMGFSLFVLGVVRLLVVFVVVVCWFVYI